MRGVQGDSRGVTMGFGEDGIGICNITIMVIGVG